MGCKVIEDRKQLVKWTELALVFTAGGFLLALVYETCRQDAAYPPIVLYVLNYTLCVCAVTTFGLFIIAYLYFLKLAFKIWWD